jgi:hypothetical protein
VPARSHQDGALGPGNVNHRLAAGRLALTYTKPRPPGVVETQELLAANKDAERLMAALLGSQQGRGTKASTTFSLKPQGTFGPARMI